MILVESLINKLNKSKIDFFTGVPDSVLKPFSSFIENYKYKNHVIATSEGSAISIGIGYYLSKKKTTLHLFSKFWFRKCFEPFNFYCKQRDLLYSIITYNRLERLPQNL